MTLIDGQQRTTTLYLLLSYLKYKLGNEKIDKLIKDKLDYKIRTDSNNLWDYAKWSVTDVTYLEYLDYLNINKMEI